MPLGTPDGVVAGGMDVGGTIRAVQLFVFGNATELFGFGGRCHMGFPDPLRFQKSLLRPLTSQDVVTNCPQAEAGSSAPSRTAWWPHRTETAHGSRTECPAACAGWPPPRRMIALKVLGAVTAFEDADATSDPSDSRLPRASLELPGENSRTGREIEDAMGRHDWPRYSHPVVLPSKPIADVASPGRPALPGPPKVVFWVIPGVNRPIGVIWAGS